MSAMTTRTDTSIQNGNAAPSLPQWLRYMIAAYPAAKAEPATMAVYEDAFLDIDPAVLLQAMRTAVKEWEWAHRLPSIPFILERVEAINNKVEYVPERVNLTAMRQDLINRAECDDCPEASEWIALQRLFIANKRTNGAAYINTLFQRYTGQELTAFKNHAPEDWR